MTQTYDLVVIGGGPGGYVAAIRAAQLKMSVALIDKRSTLGGTCLNIGCIPSKALLDSSEYYHIARADAALHGMHFSDLTVDLAAMMKRKDQVVGKLVRGVADLMRSNKITVINGTGTIGTPPSGTRSGTVRVGDTVLGARHILLASGSVPQQIASCPTDGERIVTSTEALAFDAVPRRLLVIGGGAIGLELGSVWLRLGAEVTVCEMQSEILPVMDQHIGRTLRRALEQQGMRILRGAAIQSAAARGTGGARALILDSAGAKQTIDCDRILVAVGRRPYTAELGLAEAQVKTDDRGFVEVDERYRTTVAGIYAIGDLIRRGPMLAHKAEEEGGAVAELLAGRAGHVNYRTIPNVVYTTPEVATVGLSEEELKQQGISYKMGRFPFAGNGRALAMNAGAGFVRIFADAKTDRVRGVQVVGARASDLIAEAVLLMEFDGSAEDLARTIHAHPTLTEAMREAALDVEKRAIHMV